MPDTIDIDALSISIKSNASSASKAIDKLTASVAKLRDAVGSSSNFSDLNESIKDIRSNSASASSNIDTMSKRLDSLSSATKKGVSNFTLLNNALSVVRFAALLSIIKRVESAFKSLYSAIIEPGIEWQSVVNMFGTAFGSAADEYATKIQNITNVMKISEQQFLQYTAVFRNLIAGYGVASAKANEMALGLTEMAYDISAYDDAQYTLTEALNATRSAITGEIEPIRNAGITLDQASLKAVAVAHGITTAISSMTQAQKSILRYTAMVEQMNRQGSIGQWAHEMNTAEGQVRMLKQEALVLAQTLGQALIPVLLNVIPYVVAFIQVLEQAAYAIAKFFGAKINYADWSGYFTKTTASTDGLSDSLGGATKKAKQLKGVLAGFDELNILSTPSPTSGSGTSVGTNYDLPIDVKSIWDQSLLDSVNERVSSINANMQSIVPIIVSIVAALTLINGMKLFAKVGSFVSMISSSGFFVTLIQGIKNAAGALVIFTQASTGIELSFGAALGVIGAVVAAIAAVIAGMGELYKTNTEFKTMIDNVIQDIKDKVTTFYMNVLKPIFDSIGSLIKFVWEQCILPISNSIGTLLSHLWTGILSPIIGWLNTALGATLPRSVDILATVFKVAFKAISLVITSAIDVITGIVDVISWVLKKVSPIVDAICSVFTGIVNTVIDVINGIKKLINGMNITFPTWLKYIPGLSNIAGKTLKFEMTSYVNGYSSAIAKGAKGANGKVLVNAYASGGKPDMGDLFIANENGPELVGTINGSSAVANQNSIFKAIDEHLKRQENGNGSGDLSVNVYADSGILFKTVVKEYQKNKSVTGKAVFA